MSGDRIELLARINKLEQENEELREREIPKKPNIDYVIDDTYCFCPVCGHLIIELKMINGANGNLFKKDNSFCSKCGQALNWSDEE